VTLAQVRPSQVRGLSLLLSACGIGIAALLWRTLLPLLSQEDSFAHAGFASMGVRVGWAAAALLPSCLVLSGMIAVQMGLRLAAGAFDPTAGPETRLLQINQRVITNTVEQMTVFAPSLLALGAALSGGEMAGVVALGLCFAAARLAFWAGYLANPLARAPGMAASFACNAACMVAAAWNWLN
jgi:uncharacterized membrane protein YecN with MAPEG domain